MKKLNKKSNSLASIKAEAQKQGKKEAAAMEKAAKEALRNTPAPEGNNSPEHLAAIAGSGMQPTQTGKKGKKEPKAPKAQEPEVPQVQLPFSVPAIESGYMEIRDVKGEHVLASIDLYRATNLERRNRRPLWIVSFNGSGKPSVLLDATKETQRDGFARAMHELHYAKDVIEAALRQIKAQNTIRDGATAKAKPE